MTSKISNNVNAAIGGTKEKIGHATGNEKLAGHGAAQKADAQIAKNMHGSTQGAITHGTTTQGANLHDNTHGANVHNNDAYGTETRGAQIPGSHTHNVGTGSDLPGAQTHGAGMRTHAKGVEHNVEGGIQKAVGGATNNQSMEARGHDNSALGDVERRL